ncbi:MAG: hypothetical protein F6J89_33675 [Symploca sp. SIO1C4]|uniref:Uncharacterized protein n=1 Tax=Symploca sp. SIO1C4 TaxID=2607765 RepID=A0A6B3NQ20_9CYAN|nr:hypothetical protein [Symploca sp. SIO1C4]
MLQQRATSRQTREPSGSTLATIYRSIFTLDDREELILYHRELFCQDHLPAKPNAATISVALGIKVTILRFEEVIGL